MQVKVGVLGLCFLGFGLSNVALSQDDNPKSFRINNIRSNGSGCPLGTVAVNISEDQQAFTLSYSAFFAEVSPSLGRQMERKNCRVVFDTEQDAGWEYAILAVTYRGFAALDGGVQAQQSLRFGKQGRELDSRMDLVGPYDDNYINSQEVPMTSVKWSGCQSNKEKDFAINAIVALQAPDMNSKGLLTVDTSDGEIRQEYEVLWRECRPGKKSFAVCRLKVPARQGQHQLLSKAQGRNDERALTKARAKMAMKCDKLKNRAPLCQAEQAVCSLVSY